MIEVWRGRQRKPRRTETTTVVHHFVLRPDNLLELDGVGALRRFDEYELAAGAEIPIYLSLRSAKVIVVLGGQLLCRRDGWDDQGLAIDDVLLQSGAKDSDVMLTNIAEQGSARFLLMTVAASAELKRRSRTACIDPKLRIGTALPFVSGQGHPEAIALAADVALYAFTIRRGENLIFETIPTRSTYIHLTAGSLRAGNEQLQAGDSARFRREGEVQLTAVSRSEGILIDAMERTGASLTEAAT